MYYISGSKMVWNIKLKKIMLGKINLKHVHVVYYEIKA